MKIFGKKMNTNITETGQSILEKANEIIFSVSDEIFRRLSNDEAKMLVVSLKKLRNESS